MIRVFSSGRGLIFCLTLTLCSVSVAQCLTKRPGSQRASYTPHSSIVVNYNVVVNVAELPRMFDHQEYCKYSQNWMLFPLEKIVIVQTDV